MQLHLECCFQFQILQYKKQSGILKWVQWMAKKVTGYAVLDWWVEAERNVLFSLERWSNIGTSYPKQTMSGAWGWPRWLPDIPSKQNYLIILFFFSENNGFSGSLHSTGYVQNLVFMILVYFTFKTQNSDLFLYFFYS